MRFRVPELFLGVFLAVAIFAMGMLFSSQYSGQTTQAQRAEKADNPTNDKGDPKGFWQTTATDPVAAFTLGLVLVGLFQAGFFFVQLKLIRESLGPAKEAAEAAKLNAEAVMTAEGAHLYPVLQGDNLKQEVFKGVIMFDASGVDTDPVPTPEVSIRFKNYGKTPAVFESVMWGLEFYPTPSKDRTMFTEPVSLIEIVGAGEETGSLTIKMPDTFNRGMAKSVREYKSELLFFGEVIFKDFFNRRFQCIWECEGHVGGFRLVRVEERRCPDK